MLVSNAQRAEPPWSMPPRSAILAPPAALKADHTTRGGWCGTLQATFARAVLCHAHVTCYAALVVDIWHAKEAAAGKLGVRLAIVHAISRVSGRAVLCRVSVASAATAELRALTNERIHHDMRADRR